MDILDELRIIAVTPYFKYYGLQDMIPLVEEELSRIRQTQIDLESKEQYSYSLHNITIFFDNSFKACKDTKLFLIDKIIINYPKIKYNIDVAGRALRDRMNKNYQTLKKKGLNPFLHSSTPSGLNLVDIKLDKNKITFHIVVYKSGNKYRTYDQDLGEFSIIV